MSHNIEQQLVTKVAIWKQINIIYDGYKYLNINTYDDIINFFKEHPKDSQVMESDKEIFRLRLLYDNTELNDEKEDIKNKLIDIMVKRLNGIALDLTKTLYGNPKISKKKNKKRINRKICKKSKQFNNKK